MSELWILNGTDAVDKHLALNALAISFLWITSLFSLVYAMLAKQDWVPEMKHRWILTELTEKSFPTFIK